MARASASAGFAAVWTAITAIQFYYSLNLQPEAGGTTTTTSAAQASASAGDFQFQQIFLTIVATGGFCAAVVLLYRRLHQAEAGAAVGAGGGDWRPSDLVAFISGAVAVLEFFLFVDDVGAVCLAAARVLPATSIATFFVGIILIILAHIRAGGEGGGGGAVAGGDGAIQAPVWLVFLTKMAFAAAAGLVALMTIALCAKY